MTGDLAFDDIQVGEDLACGACCLSGGQCEIVADSDSCTALGGAYGGTGTICSEICGACCDSDNDVCVDDATDLTCDNTFHVDQTCRQSCFGTILGGVIGKKKF